MSLDFSNRVLMCVSVIAQTQQEVIDYIKEIKKKPVDVIEWRTDYFEGDIIEFLPKVIEECANTKLMFTYRTKLEGGSGTVKNCVQILEKAVRYKGLDAVDIELTLGEEQVEYYIKTAKSNGITTIASAHYFEHTPYVHQLCEVFSKMKLLGADIAKIAAMPKNIEDVVNMIRATNESSKRYSNMVGISMSKLGAMTRLCPEQIGSCLTFAAGVGISAPGQLSAKLVNDVINELRC